MKLLKPERIYTSLENIDFLDLASSGYQLVLLDIDNTLVMHGTRIADDFSKRILLKIQNAGLKPYIISNAKFSRAKTFSESLGVPFQGLSGKPSPKGILRALQATDCQAQHAVMIGDQLFTDVIAANRAKVLSILVLPLSKHEAWNVAIKRIFEAPFLASYKKEPHLWPER